jgi:NAD-dependent SIR2 family protein deacetylase
MNETNNAIADHIQIPHGELGAIRCQACGRVKESEVREVLES